MNTQANDLFTSYNAKALETMNVLTELATTYTESFISKQSALSSSLMEVGVATSQELSAVKTPAEAVDISSKMFQTVAASVTAFVQESTANTLQSRESLKAIIDDSYAATGELATKTFDQSVEAVKTVATPAAKAAPAAKKAAK